MISWPALLLLIPLISAFPIEHRTDKTACGKFDTIPSGSYSLMTNLWGESSATSGSQCATLKSIHGHTTMWSTQWTWTGEDGIKSFSNIQLNEGINRQLDAISSMPSTWHWSQKGSGHIVSDVAYDLFTSDTPGGSNVNEAMIWLANFNAGPISYEYEYDGQALPVAKGVNLAGHSWNLYWGSNGYNHVYSFLPASGTITSFSGDIYEFLKYLIDNGYISSSEYLKTAQAGTEATYGSATFETSAYTLSIH